MFDVIWTDHKRELVGERRARKELGKELQQKDDDSSAASTSSVRSASSSKAHRHVGFLESIGLKKLGKGKSSTATTDAEQSDAPVSKPNRASFLLSPQAAARPTSQQLLRVIEQPQSTHKAFDDTATNLQPPSGRTSPLRSSGQGRLTPEIPS